MAAFEEQLPTELMEQFEFLDKNTDTMLKEMTREGAKKVLANVKANVPPSFRKSGIMKMPEADALVQNPVRRWRCHQGRVLRVLQQRGRDENARAAGVQPFRIRSQQFAVSSAPFHAPKLREQRDRIGHEKGAGQVPAEGVSL